MTKVNISVFLAMLPGVKQKVSNRQCGSFIMNSVPLAASPKFIYVWSGLDFPYLNLVSVRSLLEQHPDAQVTVALIGERPGTYWFECLAEIGQVQITEVDPEALFQSLPSDLREVGDVYERLLTTALSARSNLIRYALLYLHGGIYVDFDVVFVRPIDELLHHTTFIGEEMVWADDETRLQGERMMYLAPRNIAWALSHCAMWVDSHVFAGRLRMARLLAPTFGIWSRQQLNNAVIGATPGSDFIRHVLRNAIHANHSVRYATGPTLVDLVVKWHPESVTVLPADYFYCVPPGQSYRFFFDKTLQLPDGAVLIHFAASNHPQLVRQVNESVRWKRSNGTAMARLLDRYSSFQVSERSFEPREFEHA